MRRVLALGMLAAMMIMAVAGCNSGPNQDSMVDSQKKLEELDKKDGNEGSQL